MYYLFNAIYDYMEFINIWSYMVFCLVISAVLFSLSLSSIERETDDEKFSSYECGFNPFGDARSRFEIKFYLVGILFIIFDLEIMYLYPWIISIPSCDFSANIIMLSPLIILILGLFMNE